MFCQMFFVAIALVLMVTSLYVVRRSSQAFELSRRVEKRLLVAAGASLVVFFVVRALRGTIPDSIAAPVGAVVFVTMLSFLMSAILLFAFWELPAVAARLIVRLHARRARAPAAEVAPEPDAQASAAPHGELEVEGPPPPRRAFLQQVATGSALAVGGGASAYGALFGRHDYAIEEVPVRLEGLPPTLEGFTIVQLSDLHVGTYVGEGAARAGNELCRKARPDLIVLTGDLVDHDPAYAADLGRWIEQLGEIAPVVAVVGNHDYYAGVKQVADAIVRARATLLDNRGITLGDDGGKVALLGVDDVWAKRRHPGRGPDLERAIATVPRDLPRVLLCHNPSFFPEAAGKVGLMLSGHTHGGQVNLVVRPANYVLPYGYVEGRYERSGSTLYVNRGFGTAGPPVRVQSAPEVSKIVLTG